MKTVIFLLACCIGMCGFYGAAMHIVSLPTVNERLDNLAYLCALTLFAVGIVTGWQFNKVRKNAWQHVLQSKQPAAFALFNSIFIATISERKQFEERTNLDSIAPKEA